jgi:mannosylglycerate synthase
VSSLVVFPFKTEDPDVAVANVRTAASHARVGEVLGIGVEEESTWQAIASAAPAITAATGTPVNLILQGRIGTRRPGKGDGMNTGLRYFLETSHERLHFYDTDITSFDGSWITKAEEAADLDYEAVRHFFPRSATDAMITWMVTRAGFAMLFPRSELPWIEQPLGGELLLKRKAVEALVADGRVAARSDWGIDTMITFSIVQQRLPMIEVYVARGKAHKLYGALTDLRTMLVECFVAIQDLRGEAVSPGTIHHIEYPDVVPHAIAERVGFLLEPSLHLLTERWTDRQEELLRRFPIPIRDGLLASRQRPTFRFMQDGLWYDTLTVLLDEFVEGDDDWEELLFRLWLTRVLGYTAEAALRGYGYALRSLHAMVFDYLRRSALAG